jgi:hypothetical protein
LDRCSSTGADTEIAERDDGSLDDAKFLYFSGLRWDVARSGWRLQRRA